MVFTQPPSTMGWLSLKIFQNFVVTKFVLTFMAGWTSMGGVKSIWRVIFIIILLHFHYFISLETANTQKSEVFLLRISSGNVNAWAVVMPISSNLLKNSWRKISRFVLFELLPTALLTHVWSFVTTQHEWVNKFPGFFGRTLMKKQVSWYKLGI